MKYDFLTKMLIVSLLRVRLLTKTQARIILARNPNAFKKTINALLNDGIIIEKRHSVFKILRLTDKGKSLALALTKTVIPDEYLKDKNLPTEPLYTVQEVSEMLNRSPNTIRKILRENKLGYKIAKGRLIRGNYNKSKMYFIPESDLERIKSFIKRSKGE